mgnify:FL=1
MKYVFYDSCGCVTIQKNNSHFDKFCCLCAPCITYSLFLNPKQVRLEYGGGDITQIFYWLLQKCAFPYKECSDQNKLDTMLLRKLKEDFCHVNLVRDN